MAKLWGGRFDDCIDPVLEKLNSSINTDQRLWRVDIKGSKAYAKGLKDINLLTQEEENEIQKGLDNIYDEWENEKFAIQLSDEDIHTAIERRLKEMIGPETGGKLHTGRSRNDQVSNDMRLYIRHEMYPKLSLILSLLLQGLKNRANQYILISKDETTNKPLIFPGYTHLQRAQPVAFSHWILSYAWPFKRDLDKLKYIVSQEPWGISTLSLGSGAIAGNPLKGFDRIKLAKELDFQHCSLNSMDATSDRDFIMDILYWASIVGIHLSRLSEDLILYSTKEFGYIILPDKYTTGSSLMPQKKNPDSLELIRGKSAILISNCNALLVILKGLPSTYNKDLQDDKRLLFDSFDILLSSLKIMVGIIDAFELPFRDAHHVSGKVVNFAEKNLTTIDKIDLKDLKNINPLFEKDVINIWNYVNSVEQYKAIGGTGTSSILSQINVLDQYLIDK
ncbi:unnamed protein product [Gordionus sp. m RMFG-2023]